MEDIEEKRTALIRENAEDRKLIEQKMREMNRK